MYNKHFKTSYTQEECNECFAWFEARIDRLPKVVELPPSDYIGDVRFYVERSLGILKKRMPGQEAFRGEFSRLLYLREMLEKNYGVE